MKSLECNDLYRNRVASKDNSRKTTIDSASIPSSAIKTKNCANTKIGLVSLWVMLT